MCSSGFYADVSTNARCNNINHVWSHFCKLLVILKYHRRLWANIFDTYISRCINTFIKVVFLAAFLAYLCSYKCRYQRYWLQNYQKFTEMTSNIIYIVGFGVGLKCPPKIHLNPQCPPPPSFIQTDD